MRAIKNEPSAPLLFSNCDELISYALIYELQYCLMLHVTTIQVSLFRNILWLQITFIKIKG